MNKIMYQGQLNYIDTKKSHASSTYTEYRYGTIRVCHRITSRYFFKFFYYTTLSSTNISKENKLDDDMIPVNNYFTHWIKDVNIKRYGDDIAILPINKTLDIYRYSDAMLKHLPDDVLATFQEDLLYSKKSVIIIGNANNTIADRRNHIAAAARQSNTDANLNDRIAKVNNNNQLFAQKY